MKEKEQVVDAEEVMDQEEKLSAKIQAEIDRLGAPIEVSDVEKYLKAKGLIPAEITIDQIDRFPQRTLEEATSRTGDLINATAEWSIGTANLL